MLAWVVTYRRHLRHSTPISSSLRTQRPCVKLSDSFPPSFPFASHLPYLLPSSVSCKPFVCHSYENFRDVYQQFPFWNSHSSLGPITQVLSFQILAHSLAHFCTHTKLKSFLFSRFRTLHQKKKQPPVYTCPPLTSHGSEGLSEHRRLLSRILEWHPCAAA